MTKKKINLIIADDHQIFLDGLVALIKDVKDINIVGTALNGRSVLNLLKKYTVDIVLLDINMPEMDGIELNKIIKKEHPEIKTLVLTTHNYPDKIVHFAKDNANGYLLKNVGKIELLTAIYSVINNENYFSEEMKKKYMNSVFNKNNTTDEAPLSEREKEIIKLIMKEYTTQEIAEKLYISQHTVNTHRKNILTKLNIKNVAGLAVYAIKNGIID
ncbi:response regulator transcription factor [Abyssalbus ytuae]|uniref:Response regulator transcription factor n=1 Tax=Abyssalbus ytuae TaxID=2926907 RepID=A0A9E7A2E7_9FLAO|nr:response regulator transcription factor [Abyssalbus ytuae]UOB18531.1 response regulator transcription factor [Abyssalbus ytuae]